MVENLENKIQAPVIVLADGLEFTGSGFCGVHFGKTDVNPIEGFTSLGYGAIEAVYDAEGKPQWQNWNYDEHRKLVLPEHQKGTQVVLTDHVVYEGPNMGGLHFSFLKDGKYIGHDHSQNAAIDFGYGSLKAIFDKLGKPVWENWNYKSKEAQPKE